MSQDDSSERHHFKIGEVAELVGVRPHVLRYWEQEFPGLRPKKTRGSHRHYSRQNVELAQAIRRLVVDEGYSLVGAKRRLTEARAGGGAPPSAATPSLEQRALLDDLRAARTDLVALLDYLDGNDGSDAESAPPVDEPVDVAVVVVSRAGVRKSGA